MKLAIFIIVVAIGVCAYIESTQQNNRDNFNISQASNNDYVGYPDTDTSKKLKINTKIITSKQDFINKLNKLILSYNRTHLFKSVVIGQAIQESWVSSKNSVSGLVKNNLNLFGIKLRSGSKYKDSPYPTQEYNKKTNKFETVVSSFQKYPTWTDSIKDHYDTLRTLHRYRKVFLARDRKEQIIAIHKAGWATDPNYSKSIISIIEQNRLYLYDK